MATIYVGPSSAGAADGTSWANRYGTLNAAEDRPVAAGDVVYVGPGVYRELLACDVSGSVGSPITYIGDVTGEHTDGIGGIVRITGSDNDQTATRATCISNAAGTRNYREFRGFHLDTTSSYAYAPGNGGGGLGTNCTFRDCVFQNYALAGIGGAGASQASLTVERCLFFGGYGDDGILFTHTSGVDNTGHNVSNCIFSSYARGQGVNSVRIGGITVSHCVFWGIDYAVRVQTALTAGQTVTVNNCIIHSTTYGLSATAVGEIVENYNAFSNNNSNRTNTDTGANSNTYPPLFAMPILLDGIRYPWQFGSLSEWSPLRAIAGTGMAADDLYGITRPTTDSKKSWGAVQYSPISRETTTKRTGAASIKLSDAGAHQMFVPTTAVSTVFSCYVYREADYTGTSPQMIIKQPGQSDTTVTDAAAASQWNQLTTTLTPAADPPYVVVEFRSLNTATSGAYDVFIDDFVVS